MNRIAYKYYLILFLASWVFSAQGQDAFLLNDTLKNTVVVRGSYAHNSTALTNEFIKSFYLGKYLSDEIKNNVNQRLKNTNIFGLEMDNAIYGIIHFDSVLHTKNQNLLIGISQKNFLNLNFPDNLFRLVFYGNKPYAGDSLRMPVFSLLNLNYQSFDVGWIIQSNYEGISVSSGIKLSLILGKQLSAVTFYNGYFYTSSSGNELSAGAVAEIIQSDTANPTFAGTGGAMLFFTELVASKTAKIHIELSDLGFINWNTQTQVQQTDTGITFNGIDLTEIINGNQTSGNLLDSTDNYFIVNKKQRMISLLPAAFTIYYQTKIKEKWQLTIGLRHRLFLKYNTYFWAQTNYQASSHIQPSMRIAYGGYGNLAIGAGMYASIAQSWKVNLYTYNLEGIFFQKSNGGLSLQAGIIKQF